MKSANDKAGGANRPPVGFIKAPRTGDGLEIIRDYPLALAVLYAVALTARRDDSVTGLMRGETLLAGYRELGMTRREYRTSLEKLEKWGYVSIRPATRGTIVKLEKTTVFDINETRTGHQAATLPATLTQHSSHYISSTYENNKTRTGHVTGQQNAGPDLASFENTNTCEATKNKEVFKKKAFKDTPPISPVSGGTREPKRLHGDFVLLTDTEHQRLMDDFGADRTATAIRELSDYIGATGKKYKSHYFALRNWMNKRFITKGADHGHGTSTRRNRATSQITEWPDDTPR